MSEPIDSPARPGIQMLIDVRADRVTVLRAADVHRVGRLLLRAPLLTAEKVDRIHVSASELVLAILDEHGTVLDQFGWSTKPEVFVDRIRSGDTGDFRGGPVDSPLTTRIVRVPLPPEAVFAFFYRSSLQIVETEGLNRTSSFSQQGLALYDLRPPGQPPLPIPPLPVPGLPTPAPLPLPKDGPWIPPSTGTELESGGAGGGSPSPPVFLETAGGYIVDYQTVVNNGNPANRFDIVIVGDGFDENELGDFDAQADVLVKGLANMPPFAGVAAGINFHVVRTVSKQSGVDDCPNIGVSRNTYYNVEGNFYNEGFAANFGTQTPDTVIAAAELLAPWQDIDIVIVIVNCTTEGGSADREHRFAFVSAVDDDALLDLAAHESTHVIAGSADEYIGCEPGDPLKDYPNQITSDDKDNDNVWWKKLALADELNAGAFRAVHVYGDKMTSSGDPIVPKGLKGMLGLYWGCQDADYNAPPDPPTCAVYDDPVGANFYRGMAKCKMRRQTDKFCRVCSYALVQAINSRVV